MLEESIKYPEKYIDDYYIDLKIDKEIDKYLFSEKEIKNIIDKINRLSRDKNKDNEDELYEDLYKKLIDNKYINNSIFGSFINVCDCNNTIFLSKDISEKK